MTSRFLLFAALPSLCAILALPSRGETIGAYWSFQDVQSGGTFAFEPAVTFSSLEGATPTFTRTGTALSAFTNFGPDFTAFDGTVWSPGRCVTWVGWGATGPTESSNNSFSITFDSTNAEDFQVRFMARNNALKSGGSNVTAFTAFEYNAGSGFVPVPGADLSLPQTTLYDYIWTADLSSLTEIENSGTVTLRWTLPDFDNTNPTVTQLRVDDLQITGTQFVPPTTTPRTRYLPTGNYNVLFFAVDDLKANFGDFVTPDLVQAMPKPVTPNLDTLAASGMAFTRAYCQQAVCWASRISLLTGCRPDTTKIWDNGPNFRDTMPGVVALPQHFANRGFSVAGFGKIYDFRSTPPNQDAALSWPDGFSSPGISNTNSGAAHNFYEDGHWQAEQAAPTGSDARRTLFSTDAGVTNFWVTPNRPVDPDTDYPDGLVTGAGISKLNQFATNYLNTGKRFFLGIGLQKPHLPFTSPKTFWDLYDPSEIDLAGYNGSRTPPAGGLAFTNATYEIDSYGDVGTTVGQADARRLIHGYLAATSFADYQFGRVLAALQASGVAENTIIVVWGDHGWHLGDHNGYWTKHTCFENATRSPLIIRAPGMDGLGTAGKACAAPVELVDIYPTLVDLANLPEPSQPAAFKAQGTSLRPLLEDPAQPWKKGAFSQYSRFISGNGIANPGNGMGYTVRTDRYRYTEWWRTQTSNQSSGGFTDRDVKLFGSPEFVELYDHNEDPYETVNLAGNPAHASLQAELSAMLAGGNGWSAANVDAPANYPVDYSVWQAAHDIPGIDALVDLDPDADPDFDRVRNRLEYKMGTHPLVADWDSMVAGIFDDGGTDYLTLEYDSVPSRIDVSLQAERSSTLFSGSFTTTGIETGILSTTAGKERTRSRLPVVPGEGRAFLRLRAETD